MAHAPPAATVAPTPSAPPPNRQHTDAATQPAASASVALDIAPPSSPPGLHYSLHSFSGVRTSDFTAAAGGLIWLRIGATETLLSSDRGSTFRRLDVPLRRLVTDPDRRPSDGPKIRDFCVLGRDLFVATEYEVFVARNLAAPWRRLLSPTLEMASGFVAPSPVEAVATDGQTLFVLENVGRFHLSADGGRTFTRDATIENGDARQWAFLKVKGNTSGLRYLRNGNGETWHTTDAGAHWSLVTPPKAGWRLGSFSLGPTGSVVLALAGKDVEMGLFRAADGGDTWFQVTYPGKTVVDFALGGEDDYSLLTESGLYRSVDQGRSWSPEAIESVSADVQATRDQGKSFRSVARGSLGSLFSTGPNESSHRVYWLGLWRAPCEAVAVAVEEYDNFSQPPMTHVLYGHCDEPRPTSPDVTAPDKPKDTGQVRRQRVSRSGRVQLAARVDAGLRPERSEGWPWS